MCISIEAGLHRHRQQSNGRSLETMESKTEFFKGHRNTSYKNGTKYLAKSLNQVCGVSFRNTKAARYYGLGSDQPYSRETPRYYEGHD